MSNESNDQSNEEESYRVYFEESGGGWGNPLLGRVFDSIVDLPETELQTFKDLLERLRLGQETAEVNTEALTSEKSLERRGPPGPSDSKSFQINAEIGSQKIDIEGTFQSVGEEARELINFIRQHSREHEFK